MVSRAQWMDELLLWLRAGWVNDVGWMTVLYRRQVHWVDSD